MAPPGTIFITIAVTFFSLIPVVTFLAPLASNPEGLKDR